MADSNTIARIGGILKNTYGPKIVEQQNLTAFSRKRYGKADNAFYRPSGDHFEFPARIGGNRASIAGAASDDALLPASQQKQQKFQIFDRGYTGQIKLWEADIDNSKGKEAAFITDQENEVMGLTRDILKVINIDLVAGDGSGVLSTINAGATSATQALAVGTGSFQYGSRYIQANDVIDIYDATLTTSRTAGAGVTVTTVTQSTGGGAASLLLSASVTTTTGDIVTRGPGRVNKVYAGLWAVTHNQALTSFQGLNPSTTPLLQSNRINASGQPLTESLLRSLQSVVSVVGGGEIDEYLASHAQFDAYEALAYAQKRFMDVEMDKGFETLKYAGKPFVKDVDAPPAAIYGLTKDTIKFGEVAPLGFSDLDGHVLKFVPGFPAYSAYMIERGNMFYTNPNQLGVIDTLSYPTNNPAYAR